MKNNGRIIIKASAGSGKTYCLATTFIDTYIEQLLNNHYPDSVLKNILAITFTNKAAEEMKHRIINFLKEIAREEETELINSIQSLNRLNAIKRREIAAKALDGIFSFYSSFNVKTIDSFMTGLLMLFKPETDLAPDIEVELEQDPYNTKSVENLFENFYIDREDEPYIKKVVMYTLKHPKNWDIVNQIKEDISAIINITGRRTLKLKKLQISIDEERQKDKIIEELKKIESAYTLNKPFQEILEFNRKGKEQSLKEIVKQFMDKNIVKRKKPDDIKPLQKIVGESEKYFLLEPHRLYYPLINKIFENRIKLAREKKKILIDEIPIMFNKLIENETIPFIYYKLEEHYKYILIDEFQDTNEIQWQTLYPLIENSLSEGGLLYIVGDKKQAIYRWRGGKSELIDEVEKDQTLSLIDKGAKVVTLKKNYRSLPEIVNFNNTIFSQKNLQHYFTPGTHFNPDKILNTYSEAEQLYSTIEKEKGYIQIVKSEKQNAKDKLFNIIQDIEKRRGLRNIGILVRTNNQVREIIELLNSKGYPAISSESMYLGSHTGIRNLMALLYYLDMPPYNNSEKIKEKRESLLKQFMLGEIFLSLTNTEAKTIEEKLIKEDAELLMNNEYKEVKEIIEELQNKVDLIPLYNLIFLTLTRLKIWDNFKTDELVYTGFLEVVHKYSGDMGGTLSDFINYWESTEGKFSLDMPDTTEAKEYIEVLTVHKAKGLEFDVVIIPDTTSKFIKNNKKTIYNKKDNYLYTYSNKAKDFFQETKMYDDYVSLIQEEQTKMVEDELNILYVAMTRAKKELHIILTKNKRNQTNSWEDFLEKSIEYNYPELSKNAIVKIGKPEIKSKEIKEVKEPLPVYEKRKFYLNWETSLVMQKHSIDEIKYAEKGEEIHRILSSIERVESEKELEEIISKETEDEKIKNIVFQFVTSNIGRRWFFLDKRNEVWREREIVDKQGNIHRPDRVIFTESIVYVIDFKTGKEKKEDIKQIKEYTKLLKKFTDKNVKGILLYLTENKMLEVQ